MAKKQKASAEPSPAPAAAESVESAREAFERGVRARDEIGVPDKDGQLPPGKLFEEVDGKIVRRRFSAY
jgi:hypothetical protein